MSRLLLGLLCTTLLSLFLLSQLLDQVVQQDEQPESGYQRLAANLLRQLDQRSADVPLAQLPSFVEQQSSNWQLPLQLHASSAFQLPAELQHQLTEPEGLLLASNDQLYLLRRLSAHPDWLLRLPLDEEDTHHPLSLWLTLGLYFGMALLLMLWLFPLLQRLNLLTKVAERFGSGDTKVRMPLHRLSYIPSLEHSFNRMASQIDQLMQENQLLASSLSHDLRTPLACFRFGLDAALDAEPAEQKNQYLKRLEKDADRMEAMVNSFLDYASLSRAGSKLSFASLELSDWLDAVLQHYQPLLQQKQLRLELVRPKHCMHPRIHADWLERAISNVISNACRFARQVIRVELSNNKQHCCITISDDGPGIDSNEQQKVLEPFYKVIQKDTDTKNNTHFGLGLAITVQILSWHQGKVQVSRCRQLGGARFSLQLPPC
ncbi:HAMP domain-containing sensor histidine kinase [Alkalimonas amylolytica]|uniref:histidine kinase n=1 Tax=Alkalimonas amylolytica TaxID=152573 RepID=A0A1H3ZIZ2_ALKAM|nr:HAMP domain-containing sensor histidine kinase [Alkalimonas amylolytica]SEA23645.1 Signal transduction histidine kinase [Alkalimonas amylolytica]